RPAIFAARARAVRAGRRVLVGLGAVDDGPLARAQPEPRERPLAPAHRGRRRPLEDPPPELRCAVRGLLGHRPLPPGGPPRPRHAGTLDAGTDTARTRIRARARRPARPGPPGS